MGGNLFMYNMAETVNWRDCWWLLDIETNGLDRQTDDMIALRLACMENYKITQEREILIRPRRQLGIYAEQLTGISNQTLEKATSLTEAIRQLERLDGPLLFLDRDFTLQFLQNAYLRCGEEFCKPCLLMDRLAARALGCPARQKVSKFFKLLPSSEDKRDALPADIHLKELFALTLTVFRVFEDTYFIQNTAVADHFL